MIIDNHTTMIYLFNIYIYKKNVKSKTKKSGSVNENFVDYYRRFCIKNVRTNPLPEYLNAERGG